MNSKEDLIKTLIREKYLRSERIIKAFHEIDRIHFVPEELRDNAYLNEPLPIGFGQTISQPLTVAFMLELLDPRPGEKILEIGAGSGWKTALMAHIVASEQIGRTGGATGRVVAIERIKQLHERAMQNVSRYNFVQRGVATFVHGDGSRGYAFSAPFDKIIAGAAGTSIPIAWKEQVRVGGRIVIPIGDTIKMLDKVSPIDFKVKEFAGFRFVPLVIDAGRDGG